MSRRARRFTLAGAGVTTLLLALATLRPAPPLPSFAEVRGRFKSSEALLLDRHGVVIHELRVDPTRRRLGWTPLADVSAALTEAVVQAEDRRFHSHHGVDWLAAAAALVSSAKGEGSRRGASTISMQLAAEIDPAQQPRAGARTLRQKWAQMRAARALERQWSKAEILEAYLNRISYRGELQGIAAASRGLFGKSPSGITQPEAIVLAALIRAPNADGAQLARRACALSQAKGAPCLEAESLARTVAASLPRVRGTIALAPHVARQLLRPNSVEVTTTLDADVQRRASEILSQQLGLLRKRNVRDGALLVADTRSGEVLAYVGNAGTNSAAAWVDGVKAPRQAGSTLKPFLYGLALEQRRLTAASLLHDAPVHLVSPAGLYVPQNYDREFRGWVSARTALAGSLNVPAVRTLMLAGVDTFTERLRRLGFAGITRSGNYYGYSLALGSAEVTLWQLVQAYTTLALSGHESRLTLEPVPARATRGDAVMDASAAFVVSDILADRGARAVTFGLDNPIALPFWAAVKTGTSKDMRDNWCVGTTLDYTVGVWVGNFDGEPMHDVSGVTGAAPVWAEVMRYLHRRSSPAGPRAPEGVIARGVQFDPAVEPARSEYFLRGTEQERIVLQAGQTRTPRIAYPGEGLVLALDPDIPPDRERVFFAADPDVAGLCWQLDGTRLEASADGWRPSGGEHTLQLLDAEGQDVDRVRFVVRGAAVPTAPGT